MAPTMTASATWPAVDEIASVAEKYAAAADAERALRPEVTEALRDGGFLRHFVPSAFGGDEGGFTDLLTAVAELGRACPSTAWTASLLAHTGRMAAHLPPGGQQALWSGGPDVFIVGGLVPSGRMRPVAGGWLVSGSWAYVSGAEVADWALLCSFPANEEPARPWCFVVPRGDFVVEDTWFNLGMRATGSNTVVLDEVFVPEERGYARASLESGLPEPSARCYRAPLKAINGLSFAGPLLGATTGLVERWADWLRAKAPGPDGTRPTDREGVRHEFARSTAEISAAALLLENIAQRADEGSTTFEDIERNMRDWSFAAELLRSAADRSFRGAGTGAHRETNDLQRFWRDVHSASSHFALQFSNAAGAFGGKEFAMTAAAAK